LLQELLDKCHPLGMFDSIATLAVAQNMRELFRLVLVDTPLAPYFSENLTHEDLDEMNIEVRGQTGCGLLYLCICAAVLHMFDVDTPLAPYFSENLTHEDLDEMNIEVRG
jgi:hypothetical protein